MADKKTEKLAEFYKQCQEKGYTDMHNDMHSLKAKVIAKDLGLNYVNISKLYEKAADTYKEEKIKAAKYSAPGTLLLTFVGSKTIRTYIRLTNNSTYYTVDGGEKIEGIPSIKAIKSNQTLYQYNPSEIVFTAASVGGITTGGIHQTKESYSTRELQSDRGQIELTLGKDRILIEYINVSPYVSQRFKRDKQFKYLTSNDKISCSYNPTDSSLNILRSGLTNTYDTQSYVSNMNLVSSLASNSLPKYERCVEIINLVRRIMSGERPPSDEVLYAQAIELAASNSSSDVNHAADIFSSISDFKDSAERAKAAKEKYEKILPEEIQYKKEQAILREEAEKKAQKRLVKRLAIIIPSIVIPLILAIFISSNFLVPPSNYEKAEAYLDSGNYARAAIAFGKLGDYEDSRERSLALWSEVVPQNKFINEGSNIFGLLPDGSLTSSLNAMAAKEAENLTKKAISISQNNFYGNLYRVTLWSDGTVTYSGDKTFIKYRDDYYDLHQINTWENIVAVFATDHQTIGLKADGTVVATRMLWDDGKLKSDDRISPAVFHWTDIKALEPTMHDVVGLRLDGTVVATGDNKYGQGNVSSWQDIIDIATGDFVIVGLKADGTVVYTAEGDKFSAVKDWENIVAISAAQDYTVGLKADGTVVATGDNEYGQCDVSSWEDIIAISTTGYHTVGLKADGTVVATGDNEYGQCNVSGWKDIVEIYTFDTGEVSPHNSKTVGIKADGTVVVTR